MLRPLRVSTLFLMLLLCQVLMVGCSDDESGSNEPENSICEPYGPFQQVGNLALPSANEEVAIHGSYAFVAGGQAGLHIVNISNPAAPILVNMIATAMYTKCIDIVATIVDSQPYDIALVSEGVDGLVTFDVTDPENAEIAMEAVTTIGVQGMYVQTFPDLQEPYIVYMCETWHGLRILEEITDLAGGLEYWGVFSYTQGYAMDVEVVDGYAYVADDEMGLAVLDVRVLEPGAVQMVAREDTPGNALAVTLGDDMAYVADGAHGLHIFAINGPATPVSVSQIDLPGRSVDVEVFADYVLVACEGYGVYVVSVVDSAAPELVACYGIDDVSSICVDSQGLMLATAESSGLHCFQYTGE